MYLILYYVVGYRKKVIQDNIFKSFPDKSEKELNRIVREYYKHFCDLIVESVKNFTTSKKEIEKRMVFKNLDILEKFYDQGKSVITIGGHYGNWEIYALGIGMATRHLQLGVYKPMSNPFFDKKMKETRGVFGLKMVSMKETKLHFQNPSERPVSVILGSDQWPSNPERAYWTSFFGRDTPFLYGAEKYAREFDWPIVYCGLNKVKRGHFTGTYQLLCEHPREMKEGEIMEKFVAELEKTISPKPEHWLWSHRRWKRTKEEVFASPTS